MMLEAVTFTDLGMEFLAMALCAVVTLHMWPFRLAP